MSGGMPVAPVPGLFVKGAGDAGHAARLRRQAELLEIARFPGVVELVALEGPPDEPVLVTGRVDGPDLARAPELAVEEVAAVVSEIAVTLARLHDLGVVHGAVRAEHVLLSSDGRPVLCGFGYGGRTGEPPVAEAPLPEVAVDPARAAGDPLSPASDVLALGALLDGLLAKARSTPSSEIPADALRAVVARTAVADPALRPSARAVADAVRHAVPAARLPGASRTGGSSAEPPEHKADVLHALRRPRGGNRLPLGRRRRSLKAVPVALAAVALGALVVRASTDGSPRPDAEADAPPAAPSLPLPPPATAPDTVPPATDAALPPTPSPTRPTTCPTVPGLLAADTDGDGCPEALRWESGVVEADDRRWSVGRPGDLAATGDWSCTGTATLAVLRPTTGQVFVFDEWATRGRDVTGPEMARVERAVGLRPAELDGDSCPELVVERFGGPPATVPLPIGPR